MSDMSLQAGGRGSGRAFPLWPGISDINLFRYCEGVINFDAQISNGALDLGMPEQKLDSPEISGPPIDQGSFCASQGMCAKQPRIQPDAADPFRYEARILAGAYVGVGTAAPLEQEIAGPLAGGL